MQADALNKQDAAVKREYKQAYAIGAIGYATEIERANPDLDAVLAEAREEVRQGI